MAFVEDFQPEIKFRWCRTVRCRTQVVYLVLTSVTGTQVKLIWHADLGWYESAPTQIPCGLHTGFILIKEKVRDFVQDTLETKERDYKVDPFHIVPHKFAVELFLESDEATTFWSEAPELRLRYLSSDHLEKLGTSALVYSDIEDTDKRVFPGRKWASSTALNTRSDIVGAESSPINLSKVYQGSKGLAAGHSGSLGRGKSHSQLSAATSASIGGLYSQGKASTSSPNLSRAFQVAVDLSRASSKFLAGVSSTSSGVFLGFEDGSDPPSPENGNYIHTDSAYAAGGETSQESEPGEGAKKRKRLGYSRGRSLQIDDLVGDENWRPKRERARGRFNISDAPSSSYEDLLGSIAASRQAAIKSELNLMRFETLERERLVQEILHPSDSDFEDEEAPCETSNPDLQGPFQCVITFESRSTSMDDVGSPRALEDVLVSLTSSESHPESSQPQPLPRTVLQPDLPADEFALSTEIEGEEKRPTPKPRTITPVSLAGDDSGHTDTNIEVGKIVSGSVTEPLISFAASKEEDLSVKAHHSSKEQDKDAPLDIFQDSTVSEDIVEHHEEERSVSGDLLDITDPRIRISDTEDDNFQYDSLKHDDNENLPIDIRNIDSEESLDILIPKVQGEDISLKKESKEDDVIDSRTEEGDESEEGGLYVVEGAEAAFSSIDGEVPTDEVALVPLDSYKGTVREVKVIEDTTHGKSISKNDDEVEHKVADMEHEDTDFDVEITDVGFEDRTIGKDSEYIDNEESDRSETEAIFNITDVSRKLSTDSEKHPEEGSEGEEEAMRKDPGHSDETKTQEVTNGHQKFQTQLSGDKSLTYFSDFEHKKFKEVKEFDGAYSKHSGLTDSDSDYGKNRKSVNSDSDYKRQREMTGDGNGYRKHRETADSDTGYRKYRESTGSGVKGLHKQFSESDVKSRRTLAVGTNGYIGEEQNSENRKPYIRPLKLLNTGTQTAMIKQVSRTTSIDTQKFSESDTSSSLDRHPTKYSRSPLRNRTNGQADSYNALPDRLSGPWSQRLSASTSNARSSSPGTFAKPDLVMLQRNLYNLVQGDEAMQILQNSVHLQSLRNHHQPNQHHRYQSKPLIHDHHQQQRTGDHPSSTSERPMSRHTSPDHHYHRQQSTDHNHYHHQPRHHHSPSHHKPQLGHYATPYQYKYPLLSTSVIKQTSPSRTPLYSSIRSGHLTGVYSGSVTDLSRSTQRTKYDHVTSPSRGSGSGVRPASSLPDLRHTSTSIPRQTSTSSAYTQIQPGPRHAQSALDIMVGGYSSRGKRVSWREWRMEDESDSGGSTDSLIDEAENITTVHSSSHDWDNQYRKRHRCRRRRTRSHQGFSCWRDGSEGGRGNGGNRPYLPYRGDQLCPGQQVKVLAPGGGVAVAKVVTNQRSSYVTNKSQHYGMITPASVTVILMSEPNRLQGTVVTVPLEKVLLAWPRA